MDRTCFNPCPAISRVKITVAAFLIAGWVSACGPGVTATPSVEPPARPISVATPTMIAIPISPATPASAVTSTMPAAARLEAESLLVKYGLSVNGDPKLLSEGKLDSSDEAFLLYSDMSKSIGLDLASHAGQMVQWYSIPLKQRSEAEGSLSAVFIVNAEKMNDEQSIWLSKDVARKIEAELQYPGQIKVTVIREMRAVDYAK